MYRLASRFVRMLLAVMAFSSSLAFAQQTFSKEQIDQMMAPIALYPDSLLSQVLMASTYPADVAEAAKWSKANPNQKGDAAVKDLHFPGLHPDAAKWLVENRKINAVGIDTASIDYGQSTTFDSHVALMTINIPAFENVASLDKVPVKGFHIMALPMKIKGGSGAPLRIVAFLPTEK